MHTYFRGGDDLPYPLYVRMRHVDVTPRKNGKFETGCGYDTHKRELLCPSTPNSTQQPKKDAVAITALLQAGIEVHNPSAAI